MDTTHISRAVPEERYQDCSLFLKVVLADLPLLPSQQRDCRQNVLQHRQEVSTQIGARNTDGEITPVLQQPYLTIPYSISHPWGCRKQDRRGWGTSLLEPLGQPWEVSRLALRIVIIIIQENHLKTSEFKAFGPVMKLRECAIDEWTVREAERWWPAELRGLQPAVLSGRRLYLVLLPSDECGVGSCSTSSSMTRMKG